MFSLKSFLRPRASETGLLTGTFSVIHLKILNRLDPAATEKRIYVYSNNKMGAVTNDADKLLMFAWDNEDV